MAEEEIQLDKLQIFPDSAPYKTLLTKKVRNRKVWQKPDPQQIMSVIPGTVAELKVKVSEHVSKGQQLMEYEAMKMMNIIRAPFSGTIEKILVKEGEKLAKGDLMIFLRSDEPLEEITSNAPDQVL